jgi:hypothetical protein
MILLNLFRRGKSFFFPKNFILEDINNFLCFQAGRVLQRTERG